MKKPFKKAFSARRIKKILSNGMVPIYDNLPAWCFPKHQLRFKAYCVGIEKSGTTTIHAMFSKGGYRSAHGPGIRFLIYKILAYVDGKISKEKLVQYIEHRSKWLDLEMESSHELHEVVDILVNSFSEAKFILTMRDCYSWLESALNVYVYLSLRERYWRFDHIAKFVDFRFNTNSPHAKEEKLLADYGLYTLDGYLSYWRKHNENIIDLVPKNKLLILKTNDINHRTHDIEKFLGIKQGSLPTDVRENIAKKKPFNLLSAIDKNFLEEKVALHCGQLMNQYFPEIKSCEDVLR